MDAHHLFARHGKHPEWIVAAQVVLIVNGNFDRSDRSCRSDGCTAAASEGPTVVLDIGVGVAEAPSQPGQLQRADFVAGCGLDRFQVGRIRADLGQRSGDRRAHQHSPAAGEGGVLAGQRMAAAGRIVHAWRGRRSDRKTDIIGRQKPWHRLGCQPQRRHSTRLCVGLTRL